jgi:hypothetical protein
MSKPFRGSKPINPKGSPLVTAAQVQDNAAALRLTVRRGWFIPGSTEFIITAHGEWFAKTSNGWEAIGKTNLEAMIYLDGAALAMQTITSPTPLM